MNGGIRASTGNGTVSKSVGNSGPNDLFLALPYLCHASFFLSLVFYPEDGGINFLQNLGTYRPNYIMIREVACIAIL